MKTKTPILSRCLAMLLALVLSFANVPGLVLTAFAAEHTVSAGDIMADYYAALSDAEKAILRSGYLTMDSSIGYDDPKDSWVTVDHENKTITAEEKDGWVAAEAYIVVDDVAVEKVVLTDGTGTYSYDENAFSVKVCYDLVKEVDNQAEMFVAIEALKKGYDNTEAVAEQSGNLYILEQAMPELVNFANNGVSTPLGSVKFDDEVKVAVNALNAQMTANGGKLDLSKMIEVYEAGSETSYIINSGDAMYAEVVSLHERVSALNVALTTMVNNLTLFIENGWVSQDLADQLTMLAGVCANLENGLAVPAADDWYAATTDPVVNYVGAELDVLVKALGETTIPEVKDSLTIAHHEIKVNMAMSDVTVKVVLKVVENKADSKVLTEAGLVNKVITLSDGATKAEIETQAQGVIDSALAGWAGIYSAENFAPEYSELPATLTEDIEYVITYSPVDYVIDLGWAEDMTVPYGYKYTLPKHENAEQAYDYYVDDVLHAQGQIVEILGNTAITREAGKSYVAGDLYAIVAKSFGDEVAKAILTSGALTGDVAVNYRKPDPADAASLLTLVDGVLTAQDYASDYEEIDWIPQTYGENGTENGFSGNTAEWDGKSVKVQYILSLTNFGQGKAQEVLDLAKNLKAEAAEQKSAMDSLLGLKDTLAQLDKTKLGALNGVIDVTDFSADSAENAAIKAELKAIVSAIIGNNLEDGQLRILSMVVNYENNGLAYYYRNYAAIKNEIDTLAGYMSNLMDNEDALRIMCNAAGYGEYADKISDVEGKLNDYRARMSVPNAAIDVNSANLGKLVAALNMEGTAECEASSSPYVLSEMLTAMDQSQVNVQVIINTPAGNATVTTDSMDRGTVLEQAVINSLKAKIDAKVAELLGDNVKYYDLETTANPDGLVGTELDAQANIYYTYSLKEYTVKIAGEDDQTVTISDLEIDLPKHPKEAEGWNYKYTVDNVEDIVSDSYTFTLDQIDDLFVDGVYTITRVESNTKQEKFEENFGDWFVEDAEGNVVALKAKVDANKDGVMGFAMKLLEGGYEYIGLNGEPFVYMNDEDTLEICMQTFVNALLNDETFTSDMLIALGTNGKGAILNTTIQLGNEVEGKVVIAEDKPFTLYLNSVPSQMGTVSKGLDAIKDYLTFGAKDGVLEVTADLPEKVYEVYLAAMLATGNVDKTDITALNSAIAYQFLWDYIDIIVNSGATTQTYTNTLAKLGIDKDLTGYEKYYNLVQKALSDPDMIITGSEGEDFAITVNAPTKTAVDKLISVLGLGDNEQINLYVGYVKEYKGEGSPLTVKAIAKLADAGTAFEAALVDIRQPANKTIDHLNKFDFTKDLDARADKIAGEAAIILLDDIGTNDPDGKVSLVFNDTTIIDLNGHTINGTITANNGKVLIFDSSLNTYNCGGVTGGISGNVTIVGGVYGSDVTAFLPDGFVLDGNTVRNELYTNEEVNGDVIFNIDADVINANIDSYTKAAAAIAADMAVDLVLNYFTCASLDIVNTEDDETYSIYNISVEDIIGLYAGTNRKEALINTALGFVSLDDINGFINYVIDELMAFADVEAAIRGNAPILTLDAKVSPWYVRVARNANEDYIELGIVPNPDVVEEFSIGLRMVGTEAQKEFAADIIGVLSDIVVADRTDADITINTPSYKDKTLSVSGSAEATVVIDVTDDQNKDNKLVFANEDYLNVLAVVIANGVPAKRDALVAAIAPVGEMDYDAMKEAIDEVTAKELFDALKALSRNEDFADMCTRIGVTEDLGDAAKLEEIYHLVACAAGKGLETLDITGPDSKLGNLYEGGYYQLSGTRSANKSVSAKGFTINVGAEDVKVDIKVKLYPEVEECKHSETETVRENEKAATCEEEGSYDLVVYCSVCGEELSRETKTTEKLPHTPAEAVRENEVPADCDKDGSYDEVIYCSVCGEELSRETKIIPGGCYDADGDHKCDRCGNYIPNAPHDWKFKEAKWSEVDGKWVCMGYVECTCGAIDEVMPDHIHSVEEAGTCIEKGKITYTATFIIDGNVIEDSIEVETDFGDHDYGAWHTVVRPTTNRKGRQEKVCKLCGDVLVRSLPKLDEEEKEEETEKNPETGASINVGSAISAIAVIAGTAYVLSNKKH